MTQDVRTIRPAADRRVRHPLTHKLLAEAGEAVGWNSYWERLRQAGDVVVVEPDAPAAKPAVKPVAAPANPDSEKVT
jgi:hypothetical protein